MSSESLPLPGPGSVFKATGGLEIRAMLVASLGYATTLAALFSDGVMNGPRVCFGSGILSQQALRPCKINLSFPWERMQLVFVCSRMKGIWC